MDSTGRAPASVVDQKSTLIDSSIVLPLVYPAGSPNSGDVNTLPKARGCVRFRRWLILA